MYGTQEENQVSTGTSRPAPESGPLPEEIGKGPERLHPEPRRLKERRRGSSCSLITTSRRQIASLRTADKPGERFCERPSTGTKL